MLVMVCTLLSFLSGQFLKVLFLILSFLDAHIWFILIARNQLWYLLVKFEYFCYRSLFSITKWILTTDRKMGFLYISFCMVVCFCSPFYVWLYWREIVNNSCIPMFSSPTLISVGFARVALKVMQPRQDLNAWCNSFLNFSPCFPFHLFVS